MDGDDDLEMIKAKRMAELQAQMGGSGAGGGDKRAEQEAMMRQQQEVKNDMMAQLLSQQARARLNTLALTKPEKAQKVEAMLIQMARSGQIQERLSEEQLKGLLEQINEKTQKTSSVKFDRRRAALDSDSD